MLGRSSPPRPPSVHPSIIPVPPSLPLATLALPPPPPPRPDRYGGLFQRVLYLQMDRVFGTSTALNTVATKVAADALVHAPLLYVPTFFLTTSMIQGASPREAVAVLRDKWADTMIA